MAMVLLAAVPLLYPPTPPLVDLGSHIGRYRIQLEHDSWPTFRAYYRFAWAPIGNLGVDLLVYALAPLLGLENAVKLIVLAIPPLTVAGFLLTAREVHGRIPPTALFAIPLAYNFPLHFGFVNFALSLAFAFLLLPLWLRLGQKGRLALRAGLFVPLSLLLWLTHTFGWAILGVLAFGAEFARREDEGPWLLRGWRAGLACVPLAPPVLAIIAWRLASTSQGSVTGGWFDPNTKFAYLASVLRDRWRWFDLASITVIAAVFGYAAASRRMTFSPLLLTGAVLLVPCYLVLPARVFGAAYADMRMLPYACAALLLSVRPAAEAGRRLVHGLALAGLALVVVRTGGTTASLYLYSRTFERELGAVPHIGEGSRVVALIGSHCPTVWRMDRLEHISGLAIARRRAFTNDQWSEPGAQLVIPHNPAAGFYEHDASQMVRYGSCVAGRGWFSMDDHLRLVPRQAFDYLWLVQPPAYDPALVAGLRPVWRSGTSVLFRIDHGARA